MIESEIQFKLRGKPMKFVVIHNLDEYKLDIEAAFINWSHRTDDFTIDNFCEYVTSKDKENLICLPAQLVRVEEML